MTEPEETQETQSEPEGARQDPTTAEADRKTAEASARSEWRSDHYGGCTLVGPARAF